MDENDMDVLLRHYSSDKTPTLEDVRLAEEG